MNRVLKNTGWFFFGFFAIGVGLYPSLFFIINMHEQGLLSTKPGWLLADNLWNWAFCQHIIAGGISLLAGWTQFSKKIRDRYLSVHRLLGKIYVTAVVLSGSAGLYLSFFATAGLLSKLGFAALAVLWLFSTSAAFIQIRQGLVSAHQNWMIRSFALAFAAVTLRIWLPLLTGLFRIDFMVAYPVIAWLCWVPNWLLAEWIIYRKQKTALPVLSSP